MRLRTDATDLVEVVHDGEKVEPCIFCSSSVLDYAVKQAVVRNAGKRVIGVVKSEESSHVNDNTDFGSIIPVGVNWKAIGAIGVAFVILTFGTVLVFQAFDRNSHSASDTLRPFIITMAPVWAVAIAAARVLFRRS